MNHAQKMLVASIFAVLFALAPKANAAGFQMFEMNASTPAATVVLLVTGAGSINAVEISSGSAGDYCQFIDTGNVNGIALGMTCAQGLCKEIATPIVTSTNTQTPLSPALGRPFTNGLAAVCLAARKIKVWITN